MCKDCKHYRELETGVGRCLVYGEFATDKTGNRVFNFAKKDHRCSHFTTKPVGTKPDITIAG